MTADAPPSRRRPPRKVSPAYLERAALAHLNRHGSTTANLRRLLMRRVRRSVDVHGTDATEATAWLDAVLAKLVRLGYLDDRAYARGKARRLLDHGKPPAAIRAGLAAKGVSGPVITETLAALATLAGQEVDLDLVAAVAFARRRGLGPYGPGADAEPTVSHQKTLAAFARAGFSYGVTRRVVEAADRHNLEAEVAGSGQP